MKSYVKTIIFTIIYVCLTIALVVMFAYRVKNSICEDDCVFMCYGIAAFWAVFAGFAIDVIEITKDYLKRLLFILLFTIVAIAFVHPFLDSTYDIYLQGDYKFIAYMFLAVFAIYLFYLLVDVSRKRRTWIFAVVISIGVMLFSFLYNNIQKYIYWHVLFEAKYEYPFLGQALKDLDYSNNLGIFRYLIYGISVFIICALITVICFKVRVHDKRNMKIYFFTHNPGKIQSANMHFKGVAKFEAVNYDIPEIRGSLEEVATAKVLDAYEYTKKPTIALDAGFEIDALNKFPGGYVNHTLETIGVDGILKLMEGCEDRSCRFRECLVFYDGGKKAASSKGWHEGVLAYEKRGELSAEDLSH